MLADETSVGEYSDFVASHEAALRRALCAAYGSDIGREACAEALAYGWLHWDRLRGMDNAAGYLFRVGQGTARRMRGRKAPRPERPVPAPEPWIEPHLERALSKLSERQRVVVALVHAFDWSLAEVAEFLDVSKASVQTHESRAMKTLRKELGVVA